MKTLADLLAAMKPETEVVAYLDNDNVSFYIDGDDTGLDLHPYEVQEQALAALGIRTEAV